MMRRVLTGLRIRDSCPRTQFCVMRGIWTRSLHPRCSRCSGKMQLRRLSVRTRALSPTQHVPTYKPILTAVSSNLEVIVWSEGLAEATSLPRDTVEGQHLSALPFTDKAALNEVCRVRVSGSQVVDVLTTTLVGAVNIGNVLLDSNMCSSQLT